MKTWIWITLAVIVLAVVLYFVFRKKEVPYAQQTSEQREKTDKEKLVDLGFTLAPIGVGFLSSWVGKKTKTMQPSTTAEVDQYFS